MSTSFHNFCLTRAVIVQRRVSRGGFSFTEILFAIMILAIGFIMTAAMFPVAIRQTQDTAEESTATALAEQGATILGRIGTQVTMPYTNGVMLPVGAQANSQTTDFWTICKGNLICPSDTRYAWVPFYAVPPVYSIIPYNNSTTQSTYQANPSPYAQVVVIGVTSRNTSTFTSADLAAPTSPDVPNLQGRRLNACFNWDSSVLNPDTVTITADPVASPPNAIPTQANKVPVVAEGSFVIISDDSTLPYTQIPAPNPWNNGTTPPALPASCNGYIFRLGKLTQSITTGGTTSTAPPLPALTFELMPGNDMKSLVVRPLNLSLSVQQTGGLSGGSTGTPSSGTPTIKVLVVGNGYRTPGSGGTFNGPAMDVAAFTTFIKLK